MKEFDMHLWDVVVPIFWFMILFAWAWLLIAILGDLSGAATPSTADELAELADLRDRSTISDEEFRHAKAKVLGMEPGSAALAPVDDRAVPSQT
jgi:hypothetical protein